MPVPPTLVFPAALPGSGPVCRTAGSRTTRSRLCTTGSCVRGPAGAASQGCPERTSATEQTPATASHAAGTERIPVGGVDPAGGVRLRSR